ncbi:hypothetical protein D3C73_1460820 [compost metagenome]
MGMIGQGVDHRNGRMLRQFKQNVMAKRADHNPIQVAGQDPCRIRDDFTAADLQIIARQEQRMPAELVHSNLKGNTGTCGRFLKDHAERLAGERMKHLIRLILSL